MFTCYIVRQIQAFESRLHGSGYLTILHNTINLVTNTVIITWLSLLSRWLSQTHYLLINTWCPSPATNPCPGPARCAGLPGLSPHHHQPVTQIFYFGQLYCQNIINLDLELEQLLFWTFPCKYLNWHSVPVGLSLGDVSGHYFRHYCQALLQPQL